MVPESSSTLSRRSVQSPSKLLMLKTNQMYRKVKLRNRSAGCRKIEVSEQEHA